MNTLENKAKFFAQYYGQKVLRWHQWTDPNERSVVSFKVPMTSRKGASDGWFLELKPISSISDEDAIEVAKLAHQIDDGWEIERRTKDDIYLRRYNRIHSVYGLRIGLFYSADMTAWHRFLPTEKREKSEQFPVNLCTYNLTDTKPLPYIAIVDYLRSKGYALEWNGVRVREQISFGWIKLKE